MRVAAGSPPAGPAPESDPESRRRATDESALPAGILVAMHREMVRARCVDAAMIELQRQGRIPSYVAAEGQEAVAVGAAFALERTDWIFPAFRENAVLLARGFTLDRFVAQLLGSALDSQKGRQAPGYMSARSLCVASTSSAVATQLPHAVGMAWASRRDRARSAVLAFVGDGGTSSGDFHAALNFAAVFRAPCIVIVQNNQWAMSTPSSRQTAAASFAVKGRAYGVPSLRVDGGDALAVHRAVSDARARAVGGGGPTLIECVKGDDPIERLGRHLEGMGLFQAAAMDQLKAEISGEIATAVERGEAQPAPERGTLFDDVYAVRPWHLEEQAKDLRRR